MIRTLVAITALSMALGLALGTYVVTSERRSGEIGTTGRALVGGPFALVDHTGRTTTDEDFRGRYMLVYFGFTHCPDVCPAALQVMSAALDAVDASRTDIAPIFITVDPERDDVDLVRSYVSSFHPRFVGLTGTVEQVADAMRAYRVYAKAIKEAPDDTTSYNVDHSSLIYLMGPDGAYITHFSHATSIDQLTARLRGLPQVS
ncbi:MAG: SCO family protein [Hyphomicrobiaceae bacterium]